MSHERDFIVLIPSFNNVNGLFTTLHSIQYPNDKFEVLIVDDGSEDPLGANEISQVFPNLNFQILRLQKNLGVTKALNEGLKKVRSRSDYKYIARIDCGDTCNEDRFNEQVKYLNEHPDIYLLGTWCRFQDVNTGKGYFYKPKPERQDLIYEMHFKCTFIHPTVMFRKEVLETIGCYPEDYPFTEDYAFFWNILNKYPCFILQKVLVNVSLKGNSVSAKNFKEQVLARRRIVKEFGSSPVLKFESLIFSVLRQILPYRMMLRLKMFFYR